jgi:hypothetical protein
MERVTLKDYCLPTNLSDEELEKEIQKAKEESDKLKDWPKID